MKQFFNIILVYFSANSLLTNIDFNAIIISIGGTLVMLLLEEEDKKIKKTFRYYITSLLISGMATFLFSFFKDKYSVNVYYLILACISSLSPATVRIAYKRLPKFIVETFEDNMRSKYGGSNSIDNYEDDNDFLDDNINRYE